MTNNLHPPTNNRIIFFKIILNKIPILFYDGEKKWTPPIELKQKIKESENFKELIPNFKYHKIELNEIEEEKLLVLKNAMGTLLYLDKKIENKDILEVLEKSREIFEQFEETEKEKFRSHFYGFLKILSEKTDTDIEEEIKHYEEVQEMYESFAKKYIKEKEEAIRLGIQQGIQQGIQEGIQKEKIEATRNFLREKVDKKVISKAMGISIEQIKKIEEEMNENKN
jgi:predicted transposase/invertase (TIGR01784 family)